MSGLEREPQPVNARLIDSTSGRSREVRYGRCLTSFFIPALGQLLATKLLTRGNPRTPTRVQSGLSQLSSSTPEKARPHPCGPRPATLSSLQDAAPALAHCPQTSRAAARSLAYGTAPSARAATSSGRAAQPLALPRLVALRVVTGILRPENSPSRGGRRAAGWCFSGKQRLERYRQSLGTYTASILFQVEVVRVRPKSAA